MAAVYRITPELCAEFKKPFGELVKGTTDETMNKMKAFIDKEKPTGIIAVGDRVSRNLFEHKIFLHLSIIDNKCMRKKIQPYKMPVEKTFYVENPPGTITKQAIDAIKEALENNESTQIIVDGEEDLLTLIAVLYAPEKAFVIYGQPREGIVLARVTSKKKSEAADLLKAMEIASKS